MKIDEKMSKALNDQYNGELFAAYLYLAIAADMEDKKLRGCAQWLRAQAKEELAHAEKIRVYLFDRDHRTFLQGINETPNTWTDVIEAFQAALDHEIKVTKIFHGLMKRARELNDEETQVFLQWYITEQIGEERQIRDILDDFSITGDTGVGLHLIDKKLGKRVE